MSQADDFGHAIVDPPYAIAGQFGTWRVIYTVGKSGMKWKT